MARLFGFIAAILDSKWRTEALFDRLFLGQFSADFDDFSFIS
jgi:hypothetical protein